MQKLDAKTDGATVNRVEENIERLRELFEAVEGVAKLKEELKPEIVRVVFTDAGFKDDAVKTNAIQTLRQAGIEDVKSL